MYKKSILVTGCNSPQGIGFSLVRELSKKDYFVVATVKDQSKERELVEAFRDFDNITIEYLDITNEDNIVNLIKKLKKENHLPDVLVNNAGFGLIGTFEQTDISQAKREYDTNLFGTARLMQEILPHMRANKFGHIINVSSIFCSALSLPYAGFYVGTKAALEKVCESLAIEVAPWNIKITNFRPGPVKTKLSREFGNRDIGEGVYENYLTSVQKWVTEVLEYETPQESAIALCKIIEDEKKDIVEYSVPRIQNYAEKYANNKQAEFSDLMKFYHPNKNNS